MVRVQWCSPGVSRGVTALYHCFLYKKNRYTTAFWRQLQFYQCDRKSETLSGSWGFKVTSLQILGLHHCACVLVLNDDIVVHTTRQ